MTLEIRHWTDIDADYLTQVLAGNGIDATVATFDKKPVGTGQLGDCIRFSINYQSRGGDAPDTLVGKFPADADDSRTAGVQFGIYMREVKFYQELQPKARITTPNCYLSLMDEETHDFVLLMSDEAPAEQGDQLAGISIEQAKTVVCEAAKLHSAFWMDETALSLEWMEHTAPTRMVFAPDAMREVWKSFKDRFSGDIDERAEKLGNALTQNIEAYQKLIEQRQCLVHVDFRPDNMLFATSKGGKALSVVDWQSIGPGAAATDVGYCLAGALTPEQRRQHEDELLELYASELHRLGGGPYDPSEMKKHYVLGAFQLFRTAFHSSMFVERTERGDKMFLKMLNGAVDLIHDHQAEHWFA